jgi:hypothetical protein
MRIRRKQAAQAPEGVRVRRADGTIVECDVLRDPDQDRDGCAMWIAVPREPLDINTGAFALLADVLPGKTILRCCTGSGDR